MFAIGLKRAIEEDDIYAVTNDMQSEQNTNAFVQLWDLELKKTNPSIFRVMLKLYGPKVLPVGILFSIGETIARCVCLCLYFNDIYAEKVNQVKYIHDANKLFAYRLAKLRSIFYYFIVTLTEHMFIIGNDS